MSKAKPKKNPQVGTKQGILSKPTAITLKKDTIIEESKGKRIGEKVRHQVSGETRKKGSSKDCSLSQYEY